MQNVYAHIKELKEEIDLLISRDIDNLRDPKIIYISQQLDKLIVESMTNEMDNHV